MRLLNLEMKRVVKTRMTWILLGAALLLSVFLAYVPVTFQYCSYIDESGNEVELKGISAVRYIQEKRAGLEGEVTPQKVRMAVEAYQECMTEYGVENTIELPAKAYYERLMPYAPFIRGVREAFSDPNTGIAPDILEINPDEVKNYYEKCPERLESLMKMEQSGHPSAQEKAKNMYSEVEFPFAYYYGVDSDSLDYQVLLIFLITAFCAVIAAPVFSAEYQTGADDILRCTKYGRIRLGITKIVSALFICGAAYLICLTVWILITNALFGWESTKTSMQMIFSVSNLLNMNVGQLEGTVMWTSFVCFLAFISFTLFLSSKVRSTVQSLALAMGFCILPIVVYIGVPGAIGEWFRCLLPGGGIGLQNCLLYAMIDFDFLHIGGISIWNVRMILAAAAVEVPLFICLAIYSYCRNK